MSNHDEIDLMLRYIHESIKRDCERHIMLNRISLGLPPTPRSVIDKTIKSSEISFIDMEKAKINESDLKGFEPGKLIFPRDTYVKSWFWVKMMAKLMVEKYHEKQRRLLLKEGNHNKLNLSNVIWWNYPIFLYAVGRNYTEDLKVSKWNVSYVTKETCPNMSDDEIKYMNHIWNALSSDKPYTSDFNNNKPKNSWLERKTKRGK